jgi:hypothetical protein
MSLVIAEDGRERPCLMAGVGLGSWLRDQRDEIHPPMG